MASNKGSSDGPDWTDVAMMMSELGRLHKVIVSLEMSPAGGLGSGAMHITALAARETLLKDTTPKGVSRRHHWPNGGNKTMPGACYRLLVELDWDCSEMWKQERLEGA